MAHAHHYIAQISMSLFNIYMAQKNNTRKNPGLFQKIKKTKWYVLLPVIIIIALLLNLVYKKAMTKYDISLLDKAETKLRALDLPKANKTIYKRSCSVRSVKFQDPGKPRCGIERADIYKINSLDEGVTQLNNYFSVFEMSYPEFEKNFTNDSELKNIITKGPDYGPSADTLFIQNGLTCYLLGGVTNSIPLSYGRLEEAATTRDYLILSTHCSKYFETQAYSEH